MAKRTRSTSSTPNAANVAQLDDNWRYEPAVDQVETIVSQIESGELELAEVFEQFGVAVQQLQRCEAYLSQHQQQLDLVVETLLETTNDAADNDVEAVEDF